MPRPDGLLQRAALSSIRPVRDGNIRLSYAAPHIHGYGVSQQEGHKVGQHENPYCCSCYEGCSCYGSRSGSGPSYYCSTSRPEAPDSRPGIPTYQPTGWLCLFHPTTQELTNLTGIFSSVLVLLRRSIFQLYSQTQIGTQQVQLSISIGQMWFGFSRAHCHNQCRMEIE